MRISTDQIDQSRVEEFVQLLTRDQRRVFLYILSLLPNWTEAEEILQNTNLVLWRRFDDFVPGTSFYRWACGVAHLEVLKFRDRRRHDTLAFTSDFISEISAAMADDGDLIDRRHQALNCCLERLRETDRQLILLRYDHQATTQSVAKTLDRPVKSVYAAVNRIRDSLLACINRTLAAEDRQ
jgi:RNA polymerase sigma-70 factor, ECF subfamily